MANNFASNITAPLARVFLEKFESARVMSKNVNTQLLEGRFNPSTGDTVSVKRPTDYVSVRTATGDISGATASDIVTGKASGVVQDYFTVNVEYDEAAEAIEMDQLDELLAPMATRIVTDLEVDFARFMAENLGLYSGTEANYGTPISTWEGVAEAGALMQAVGVPQDAPWYLAVNPFVQVALAALQTSLGTSDPLVESAWEKAIISRNFAGLRVMSATTLPLIAHGAVADRVGAVVGTTDVTYVTAKDTMTVSIAVDAFGVSSVINAGETIRITAGPSLFNQSTRQLALDATGTAIEWTGVVTTDVTLSTAGAGTLVVSGAPVFDTVAGSTVQQMVSAALLDNAVVTLLGTISTSDQPSLFWHRDAFALASVPIKKLHSTDTLATTEDGLQFRVSKGSNFLENQNLVRFDFRPAYAVLNPYFAGQAWAV